MTPEEALAHIEAVNALAEVTNSLKQNLEARGWSAGGAEQAAIVLTNSTLIGGMRR